MVCEGGVEVGVYTSVSRAELVMSARVPLAPHWDPSSAALHAPALFLAPYH